MAITDKNTETHGAVGNSFKQAAEQWQQQHTTPPPQSGRSRGIGIAGINSKLRMPISRTSTSESVITLRDNILKVMDKHFEADIKNGYRTLVLDREKVNVGPMSAILICAEKVVAGVNNIAVYTMLVEATAPVFTPRTVNIAGRNVETDVVAGDVFTNEMFARIAENVRLTYGGESEVIDAGQMVIPREMNIEDEENIRRSTYNAFVACSTVLDYATEGDKQAIFTIGDINPNTETMIVRLDYSPGNVETATGEPVRSDVSITLDASVKEESTTEFEQTLSLTQVNGFVDLVYTQPPQVQLMMGQLPPTQRYVPRFVMTRVDSQIDAVTMELQLMAIAQTAILARNTAWAGVFRPKHNVTGIDPKDIGAIGYEVNVTGDPTAPMEMIDTKESAFGENDLYQLISMYVHNTLIYSMDVEEVGELSWINQSFLAAANNDVEQYRYILKAADDLTLGHFSKIFPAGEAICTDDNNRIHLGYYIDKDGQTRDLRDLDYLAMLNISGKDDPSMVERWEETFVRTDIPMAIRLEERSKILKNVLTHNIQIKGFAHRITFNHVFLESLASACYQAGLIVRPSNVIQDFANAGVRGMPNAQQYGFNSAQAGNMFSYGQSSQYAGYQGQSAFHGRFGRN